MFKIGGVAVPTQHSFSRHFAGKGCEEVARCRQAIWQGLLSI